MRCITTIFDIALIYDSLGVCKEMALLKYTLQLGVFGN